MKQIQNSKLEIRNSLGYFLPLLILGASIAISFVIIAQAQAEPTDAEIAAKGITFPIPELGNCGSKSECRSYCDQPGNMEACIKFAQSHGLMNSDEAALASKYRQGLASGGPGGCNSDESCESFCSNINNMETCLAFAEKHGLKHEKTEEAKKVLAYIKAGGQMPGGCTSEETCRTYCSDFNNAEECFAFAEKVGLADTHAKEGENIKPEQFRKFIELAKKGETPGGCKSKEQCESYCESESNRE